MFRHRILPCTCVLFLLFLTACGGGEQQPSPADPGSPLALEQNLVIESGAEGGEAPFLTFVNELAVDRAGNIYIYVGTDGVNEIHKYDARGNYLQTLGGEGRGPGEHRQVTAMYADSENRLITADFQNARLTVFSPSGEVVLSEPTPGINSVVQIREMPGGPYILTGWNEESQSVAHLVSRDFTRIEESVGGAEEVLPWHDGESQRRWLVRQAVMAAAGGEQGLLLAPATYGGELHRYREEETGWNHMNAVSGYEAIDPPVVYGTQQNPPARVNSMMFWQGRPPVMIMIRSISFGIYPLADGTYLHLSYRFPEEEESEADTGAEAGGEGGDGTRLVLERFSADLELMQYTVTDTLNLGTTQRKRPLWVDRSGQLYLADNSNDSTSMVRRFRIRGLGLDN